MNDHTTARTALVAGLRALADDLERSTAPLPTHTPEAQWLIFDDNEATQKATAAEVVRSIGGHWEKGKTHNGGSLFDFTKEYAGGVRAQVVVDRPAVCERVVVRTETVTVPATPAKAAKPERVEEREIVEWRCQPLLADADTEQVPA